MVVTPAIAYGPHWSGVGSGGWWLWPVAVVAAGTLGGLTWRLFGEAPEMPTVGVSALFSAAVGLVAGAVVSFPMGGLFGAVAGIPAGACGAFAWVRFLSWPPRPRAAASAVTGAAVAAVCAVGWTL